MIHVRSGETSVLTAPVVVTDDEAGLVRRAQQRDTQAFERLYRLHAPRVYALCLRLTANVRRAEELTQTAFIQLWQKLSQFRGESAFASWLHRLAVNIVLTDMRAAQRREARVIGAADPAVLETPGVAPPAGLRLDLEHAIAELPPHARAVFVLHAIEGYSHEDIAGLLGVAVGTSKAQLHRARQLLQEALR